MKMKSFAEPRNNPKFMILLVIHFFLFLAAKQPGTEVPLFFFFGFIVDTLRANKANNMYICGAPGTGKSLTVDHVLKRLCNGYNKTHIPVKFTVHRVSYLLCLYSVLFFVSMLFGFIEKKKQNK